MSNLRLNDIWRNVGNEISFFTEETFKDIPSVSGVYAWFYPLRLTTKNIDEFINEVQLVLNYDCDSNGSPSRENSIKFGWDIIHQKIDFAPKNYDLNSFRHIWQKIANDQDKFDNFRKVIMRASILLTPLYVGKASNLKLRCQQHINGTAKDNNFNARYENYAQKLNISSKSVKDLLFVILKTDEKGDVSTESEKLVEAVLKNLIKPKYSIH